MNISGDSVSPLRSPMSGSFATENAISSRAPFEYWLIVFVASFLLALLLKECVLPHGLRKQHYLGLPHGVATLDTSDKLVTFTSERQIMTDVWRHWDPKHVPYPKSFPPYRLRWSGSIIIPEGSAPRADKGLYEALYRGSRPVGPPARETAGALPAMDSARRVALGQIGAIFIEWSGWIDVPEGGMHQFFLSSDDGSWLFIDNRLIVDNGGAHPELERAGAVSLSPGKHSVRVRYSDLGGAAVLRWSWIPPNGIRELVPLSVLSSETALPALLEAAAPVNIGLAVGTQWVHGRAVAMELPPGEHKFMVDLQRSRIPAQFGMVWRTPSGRYEPVPKSAFRYPEGYADPERPILLVALVSSMLVYALFAFARRGRNEDLWFRHSLACCVAVAFALRFYLYDLFPFLIDTIDEFNAAWAGLNFILHGTPLGWLFPGAGLNTRYIKYLGEDFLIGDNIFHPPVLYSLIIGVFSYLSGARDIFETRVLYFRLPSVIFSTLTVIPLMLFVRRRFGFRSAVLSGLVFATLPLFVLVQRLAKEEVPLAFLAMLAFLLVDSQLEKKKPDGPPWLLMLVLALSVLVKEIGVFVPFFVLVFCMVSRRYALAFSCSLATAWGIVIYFAWGLLINAPEFIQQVSAHANVLSRLVFTDRLFYDSRVFHYPVSGWLLWLWLAAFSVAAPARERLATVLVCFMLVFFMLGIAPFDYPWYRLPIFPFLAIGGGLFLHRLSKRTRISDTILFLALALPSSLQILFTPAPMTQVPAGVLRTCTVVVTALALLFVLVGRRQARVLSRGVILGFLLTNVWMVFHFHNIYAGSLGGAD